MTLTPAYGRDYTSAKAVLADFHANKDFIINDFTSRYDGKPCNLGDLRGAGTKSVKLRYARLTKVIVEKVQI